MSKLSSTMLGLAGAGLIATTPAIAAGLVTPTTTTTRSNESMPAPNPNSGTVDGRKQSPILVPPGDSPG